MFYVGDNDNHGGDKIVRGGDNIIKEKWAFDDVIANYFTAITCPLIMLSNSLGIN